MVGVLDVQQTMMAPVFNLNSNFKGSSEYLWQQLLIQYEQWNTVTTLITFVITFYIIFIYK